MNFVVWLVVGGLIGWLASRLTKTSAQQGMWMNVFTGVMGALLGGWVLSPLVGGATINRGDFSVLSLVVSVAGAAALLAVVNLLQGRTTR